MILFECVNKEGGLTLRGIPASAVVEVSATATEPSNSWIRYHDGSGGLPRSVCVKGTTEEIVRLINNVIGQMIA